MATTYTVGNVQSKVGQLTGKKPRDMVVRRTARDLFKDPDSLVQMSHQYSETQFKALVLALCNGTGTRQPASASDYAESQAKKLVAKFAPVEKSVESATPLKTGTAMQKPTTATTKPGTTPVAVKVTDTPTKA